MIKQKKILIELHCKDLTKGMAILFEIYSRLFFRVSKTVSEILIDYYHYDFSIKTLEKKYNVGEHKILNIINNFEKKITEIPYRGRPEPEPKKEININKIERLTMTVSNACNMRCLYCYTDYGSYNMKIGLMTIETVDKAFDLLLSKFNQISNIMFFGGEPFLNPDTILHICEKLENLQINKKLENIPKYIVSTNGTIKSKKVENIISKHNFEVSISLDGPPEINDKLRFFHNGESAFKKISENINWFKSIVPPEKIMIEAVYTNKHIKMGISKIELHDFFSNTFGINRIRISPVIISEDNPLAIKWPKENRERSEDLNKILDSEIISYIYALLRFSHDRYIRKKSCDAGTKIFAISSDGSIWPCHFFVGIDDFLMGNVNQSDPFKSIKFQEVQNKISTNNEYGSKSCKKCWLRTVCTKGCPATKYRISGDIEKMPLGFCDNSKFLTEKALMTLGEAKSNHDEWEKLITYIKKYLGFILT